MRNCFFTILIILFPILNFSNPKEENQNQSIEIKNIATIAQNLQIPWEIKFIPDGRILITERIGFLTIISNQKIKRIKIEEAFHFGEGGLLGLALHPNFSENKILYLYFTYKSDGIKNKVVRYRFENDILSDKKIIIENIPGAIFHNGGRIAFGPDGFLYITTGDAGESDDAQNKNSLSGKILRVKDDGSIPNDNPFKNLVYSFGHRNPQGLAWDENKNLWATEHGRSGFQSGLDELNLIEKGKNYGWPEIEGDEKKDEMERPKIHSGANKTWAPSGLVYKNGFLFWTGLRGEALYSAKINGKDAIEFKENFHKQFGRLRAIAIDKDGFLFFGTSNYDGRGEKKLGGDKIYKILEDGLLK